MKRKLITQLHLERLESRQLLAGNVAVQVSNGNLIVNGDDAPNRITVESAGAGKIQVRGFNDAANHVTRINGAANALKIFSGVTGDILIHLRGGDDLVRVTNLLTPGDVLVDLGAGNDEAVTGRDKLGGDSRFGGTPSGPVTIEGELRVLGGNGDDLAFQSDLHVQGLGVTNLGAGNDALQMLRPVGKANNVDYGGNYSILPGDGDDAIDIFGLVVDGDLNVNDTLGSAYVNIRSMDVHRDFRLTTGDAADSVDIISTNVTNLFRLNTADGGDRVRVGLIANKMDVNLGDGNDGFESNGSHLESLTVHGGTGNDAFFVRNTRAIDAFFFGDDGSDALRVSASLPNRITRLSESSLEVHATLDSDGEHVH